MAGDSQRQQAEADLRSAKRFAFWSSTAVVLAMLVVFAEFWFIEHALFWPAPVAAIAAVAWSATVVRVRTNAIRKL